MAIGFVIGVFDEMEKRVIIGLSGLATWCMKARFEKRLSSF
jgi:hypothetical protein